MSLIDLTRLEKGNISLFRQAEGLKRLSRVINSFSTQEQTLAEALKVVAETLQVQHCLLLNCDKASNNISPLLPIHGLNQSELSQIQYELDYIASFDSSNSNETNSLLSNPLRQKQPFFTNSAYCFDRNKQIQPLSVRNFLLVPVQVEQATLGFCLVMHKTEGRFVDEDVEGLLALVGIMVAFFKNLNLVQRLEGEQRRHLAVLDAAVDGFIEVGRDFKITLFSKGAESLTGWSADEAVGHTCSEVLLPRNPNGGLLCNNCPMRRAFRQSMPIANVETLIHTKDAEDNWVSCSYNTVSNESGEVVSGVIAIKDIYRIKALGDELRQQIQQQESLLGVINVINGLSSIEEIYSRALGEVANAINFDLGMIHSIKENTELKLMAIFEPQNLPPTAPLEDNYFGPDYYPLPDDNEPNAPFNLPLITSYPRIFQSLELQRRGHPLKLRRADAVNSVLTSRTYQQEASMKHVQDCEALRQNEPYMSVNLPGKEICGVLGDFEGIQSHLCVPIKTQEKTYGVLHLASYKPYAFWGSDFALALSICKQIAVAAERASLFEQIDMLARTDPLTKLYNKREFWDRIEREMKRAERQHRPLSLMIIDLDRLKWYNDFYGHSQGDILLARIGQLIREKCRITDVAFRYGGDEMCLLLPDTGPEDALLVAERIRKAAIELQVVMEDELIMEVDEEESRVTMSIGISTFPGRPVETATDLFETADSAMYRAKGTGKNRSVVFDCQVDLSKRNLRRRVRPSEYQDDRLKLPRKRVENETLPVIEASSSALLTQSEGQQSNFDDLIGEFADTND